MLSAARYAVVENKAGVTEFTSVYTKYRFEYRNIYTNI